MSQATLSILYEEFFTQALSKRQKFDPGYLGYSITGPYLVYLITHTECRRAYCNICNMMPPRHREISGFVLAEGNLGSTYLLKIQQHSRGECSKLRSRDTCSYTAQFEQGHTNPSQVNDVRGTSFDFG